MVKKVRKILFFMIFFVHLQKLFEILNIEEWGSGLTHLSWKQTARNRVREFESRLLCIRETYSKFKIG